MTDCTTRPSSLTGTSVRTGCQRQLEMIATAFGCAQHPATGTCDLLTIDVPPIAEQQRIGSGASRRRRPDRILRAPDRQEAGDQAGHDAGAPAPARRDSPVSTSHGARLGWRRRYYHAWASPRPSASARWSSDDVTFRWMVRIDGPRVTRMRLTRRHRQLSDCRAKAIVEVVPSNRDVDR